MKTRLYLAGKIGKNDWRHPLIPGLRGHEWKDGPIETPDFDYVGPFFKSCDHGCNHGPNGHGVANGYGSGESAYTRADVIRNNNEVLESAHLVFAYITSVDCYGTLVEIGYCRGMLFPPRVVVAFAPGVPHDDLWYAGFQANKVYHSVRECCLPDLIDAELKVLRSEATNRRGGDL